MRKMRVLTLLLVALTCSMNAWSYRITDNYTIESKFKINTLAAGIAFRAYEGFDGQICMWQFNVGTDGSRSMFRPHDWKVDGILLGEIDTRNFGVTLNTTDWFVTKIVISNNGGHADTYLRRADDATDVLIDSRDGNFRFGLVGTRQDHDADVNESASYDYFKVTANETGDVLYYEDFEATNGDWRNDPIWADGALTTEGRNLSEVKYFPKNMFKEAVDMHYTVEADVTIESGFVSLIFGLTDSGSNYMWQISPNYYGDGSVCTYYHLDNGNEMWKAHAGGPRYPDFEDFDILFSPHHVMIEVDANVVKTYIDGMLEDTFTQCDMTDLALLNPGKVGIRVDGGNGIYHRVFVDNVKVTDYDADNNATVEMFETFDGGVSHFFEIAGKNASYASVVFEDDNYSLLIDCDGTTDSGAKVRLIQTDVCFHNYVNGICTKCDAFEEPDYDASIGAYIISNLGQLCRYAEIVNGENQGANATLISDIDMKFSDKFTPIGLNNDADKTTPFRGMFNGNNHVIRNLYVKTNCEGGLFSRLRGGKIYNLGLENGYIESTANLRCGAIAGEHHDNAIMQDCYARGTFEFVTTHYQTNALAAETAGGHFINCYTTLPKLSCDYPMDGTSENSYEGVTAERAATGELCYKLGDSFRQTLGTDTYPELDQTHAAVSYVGAEGYATFFDAVEGYTLNGDIEAYIGKVNGSWVTLTQVSDIPAGTAVVLKGTYYNKVEGATSANTSGNELLGTSAPMAANGEYVLAKQGDVIGFYKAISGTIAAGKAYLPAASSVKAFFFAEDEATAIDEIVNSKSSNGKWYNLAGQRLQKIQNGINIVDGKKMLK